MDERKVRIRLKFQDLDILNSGQLELGLAQSWYLAWLDDARTVADVATDIQRAFHLTKSCPHGLGLEVDGFVLPATQPADILQDSDLVRVTRINEKHVAAQGQILRQVQNGHLTSKECLPNFSHWPRKYCGSELRAMEEFEKETGGYEDDEEGGEVDTDLSADGTIQRLEAAEDCLEEKIRNRKKSTQSKTRLHAQNVLDDEDGMKRCMLRICGREDMNDKFEAGQVFSPYGKSSQLKSEAANLSGERKHSQSQKERKKGKKTSDGERPVEGRHEESKPGKILSREKKKSMRNSKHENSGAEKRHLWSGKKSKPTRKGTSEGALEVNNGKVTESDTVPSSDDRGSQQLSAATCSGIERKEAQNPKKRKKAKKQSTDAQGQFFKNTERKVPRVHGDFGMNERKEQKVKCKKLNSSGVHCIPAGLKSALEKADAKVVEAVADDYTEGLTKALKKKTGADSSLGKMNAARADVLTTVVADEKLGSPAANARTEESNMIVKVDRAESPKDDGKDITVDVEHIPSRSARRKKAKRRWLREQAMMLQLGGADDHHHSESNGSRALAVGGKPKSSDIEGVMEVEAEEEILPVLVRPGHIRFESPRAGETVQAQPSARGEHLKSKSKGQGRSSVVFNGKGRATAICNLPSVADTRHERCDTDSLSLATFPVLEGVPREGDVLAYRLLELTASWTPEISPCRVGIVSRWENAAKLVKLDPSREYLEWQNDRDPQYAQDKEFLPPYDENGSLEIELSSLMDVRLVRRDSTKTIDVVAHPEVEGGDSGLQNDIERCGPGTDVGGQSTEENPEVDSEDAIEDGPDWQSALLEKLQRKRIELSQNESPETNKLQAPTPASENTGCQHKDPKTDTTLEDGKPVQKPSITKDRKHKYLKSSGVGVLISLLRAQQAI